MHDWNHDGKIDLNDRFIQDEIEGRNSGIGSGSGSSGSGSGGSGSGGCCIFIVLIPIILLFLYAVANDAPSGVFPIIFFLFAVAVLFGGLLN